MPKRWIAGALIALISVSVAACGGVKDSPAAVEQRTPAAGGPAPANRETPSAAPGAATPVSNKPAEAVPAPPTNSANAGTPTQVSPTPPAGSTSPSGTAQVFPVELLEADRLPAKLSAFRQSTSESPAAAAAFDGEHLYVAVAAGEKPSGGYRVEITDVEVVRDRVIVHAVLHKPGPGQIVTMALTYPKAYARVPVKGSGELRAVIIWK